MHVDLQKRFPIHHVSQMLGGPSLRLGDTKEREDDLDDFESGSHEQKGKTQTES